MSCILRVSGESLDVTKFLEAVRVTPDRVWHKGELRFPYKADSKRYLNSGASFVASSAGLRDFDDQISEATGFLQQNQRAIKSIQLFNSVDELELDFGIALREAACHSDFLPASFLQAAAMAGVAVRLSHYCCSDEETKSEQDGGGNAPEPPSHPSTASSKSRATP